MNPLLASLVLLPAITALLIGYVARPRGPVVAPVRLVVVRTAVVLGGYAVATVELLSSWRALTTSGVAAAWAVALVVAGCAAWVRRRRDAPGGGEAGPVLTERWRALGGWDKALAGGVGVLALAELLLGLAFPPNTYDSQSYHLPRIEHWVAQHDVQFYPVRIHRQVTYPPGAEFILTHLRLLTGGDALYALLQWSLGVVAVLAVTRLVAQLGGGRTAQLLAAFVLASTPAFVLEASSTQTDLAVAGWVTCLATLVLDGVGGPGRATARGPGTVLLLGVSTGVIALTKQTGLFAAAPLLVWWGLAGLRRGRDLKRAVRATAAVGASTVVILTLAAAIAGPYLWRMYQEWGDPLGASYVTGSITMQRHDPPALLVNGARQVQTLLDTPVPLLSEATAAGVERLAHAVGVDPSAPSITFDNTTFPTAAWYPSEDKAAYPVQALLMMAAAVVALIRPGTGADGTGAGGRRRAYASVLLVGLALHGATVKWQPWGNRLFLYLVVIAAPLAGLMLEAVFARAAVARSRPAVAARRPAYLAGFLAVTLAVGGVAGAMSALYGRPRRLVGQDAAFTLDRWHARFVMRPGWADEYSQVAEVVKASGAHRIGIVQGNDTWEYPWWLLFRGRELVAMQSLLPKHRVPVDQKVDAVVCAGDVAVCRQDAPQGWQVRMYGQVGWALPADRVPRLGA